MKYHVETWEDERELCCFDSQEEREKWINKNCNVTDSGGFLNETGERVCISDY